MTELRAEPLSPLDAATLWPQLRRLSTEVLSTRAGENLLLASGLAVSGIAHLPKMPRTIVLGVRRGLGYRGVVLARELAGGIAWEAVSLRIAREKDDEAVVTLLAAVGPEAARRGGRTLFVRYAEGSPHGLAIQRAGLRPYREESVLSVRHHAGGEPDGGFRAAHRSDRAGVFRLYCRAVSGHIRRVEGPTQQEWRAVHDSYDCERELVLPGAGTIAGWAGIGDRECRGFVDFSIAGAVDALLDVLEAHGPRHATLIAPHDDETLVRHAIERGYQQLGTRVVCARKLAALQTLKEMVALPAETLVLRQ
ncbi:MAG: hypothetical protein ACKVVT_13505 [Dehalococcoidia bacterium]